VKRNKEFVAAIDELSKKIICWDNLFNPNWEILATYRPYPNFIDLGKINKNTSKIYGFDQFYQIEKLKKINIKKKISKIVLSLGGTKNHINIKYILNSIHKYNKLLKITVLIVNKEDFIFLRNNFKNNKNIKLIFRIKNVHKILQKSDLAIVSGGMSKYEVFLHCMPSLIFNINSLQKKINSNILNRKIAVTINSLEEFEKNFKIITKNYKLRKTLAMNCKILIKEYNENLVYKKFKNLI
jgi:spore coat polysaccharide biosynthesis predicted glycosyltransferase SpsG